MNQRPKLRLLIVCTAALAAFFLPLQPVMAKKDTAPKSEAREVVGVGTPSPAGDGRDDVIQADSNRRVLGTMLGVILLLLCILYWSDGFGALGLRSALAARLQERTEAYRAEDRQASEGVSGQLDLPPRTGTS
jgi:hypothetical protein